MQIIAKLCHKARKTQLLHFASASTSGYNAFLPGIYFWRVLTKTLRPKSFTTGQFSIISQRSKRTAAVVILARLVVQVLIDECFNHILPKTIYGTLDLDLGPDIIIKRVGVVIFLAALCASPVD